MRRRLPYVLREVSRHGRVMWFYRRGKGPRVRLPDEYGSKAFTDAYRAAEAGKPAQPHNAQSGTLAWLIAQWMRSSAWSDLAPATRKKHQSVLASTLDTAGSEPYAAITRKHIIKAKESRSSKPAAANNWLKAMKALFRWAVDNELMESSPADRVPLFPEKGDGFAAWTAADVARFREKWPPGTKQRLCFELFYRTGLRRSDVARLGPQHIQDGVISIETAKTKTTVYVPLDDELADMLKKSGLNYNEATGDYSFAGKTLMGFTQESMSNWFRRACREAGINKPAHGIRKLAATETAEGGGTDQQLMAAYGWTTSKQAVRYTRGADRKKLAIEAAKRRKNPEPPNG